MGIMLVMIQIGGGGRLCAANETKARKISTVQQICVQSSNTMWINEEL